MTSYEKLIKMMNTKAQESVFFIAEMDSPSTCKVNTLPLGKGDLYINETFQKGEPLKKGDLVLLAKVSSEKYAIVCKVVGV